MDTLTSQQVTIELGTTPGWGVADGQLTRTVTRKDFRDALLYVNAIGYLAEQASHHPDIAISSPPFRRSRSTPAAPLARGERSR